MWQWVSYHTNPLHNSGACSCGMPNDLQSGDEPDDSNTDAHNLCFDIVTLADHIATRTWAHCVDSQTDENRRCEQRAKDKINSKDRGDIENRMDKFNDYKNFKLYEGITTYMSQSRELSKVLDSIHKVADGAQDSKEFLNKVKTLDLLEMPAALETLINAQEGLVEKHYSVQIANQQSKRDKA